MVTLMNWLDFSSIIWIVIVIGKGLSCFYIFDDGHRISERRLL